MKRLGLAAAAACTLAWTAPAFAAADAADLAAIRNDISSLRHDYEAKVRDLEARLKKAEAEAKSAKASAAEAQVAAKSSAAEAQKSVVIAQAAPATEQSQPATQRAPASANAFNPAIGVVLNGFFSASSRDTDGQPIRGFALGDDAGLVPRGFSLGESEVNFAANIDPYFSGQLVLAITNSGEANVEEAYIATSGLGGGFTVKAGRFLSAIGYLNEHHAHQWSFSDASLPYRAFLGGQLGDDGVQVKWLAPTDTFLEFGAEWFRGDSFPAGNGANEGKGTATAFVHAGDDIDASSNWLAGLSYLHTRADRRNTGGDIFSGKDDIGIASLIYKWAPGGNPTQRNLTLSGEFFLDRERGNFNAVPVDLMRSGWYVQGVYQFMPRWSFGLRYAQVTPDSVQVALTGSTLDDFGRTPRATTALLEYDTTEFGRFRLQYTHDQSDLKPNDEILFQYTVTYGAHGAHRY
jgi:hypothetical protein